MNPRFVKNTLQEMLKSTPWMWPARELGADTGTHPQDPPGEPGWALVLSPHCDHSPEFNTAQLIPSSLWGLDFLPVSLEKMWL